MTGRGKAKKRGSFWREEHGLKACDDKGEETIVITDKSIR